MRKLCLVLIVLAFSPALFAQTWREGGGPYHAPVRHNMFELTPIAGYTWGGTIYSYQSVFNQDVEAASHGHFGVNFGIPVGHDMKLALLVMRQDTDLQTAGGGVFSPNNTVGAFHVTYYQAGLEVPFAQSRTAIPYGVFTAGVANLDPDIKGLSADTGFSGSLGVGVKLPLSRNFGMRFEGRGFFTWLDNGNDYNDCHCGYYYNGGDGFYQGQVNMGFVFSF
jgi:hypothetical protein